MDLRCFDLSKFFTKKFTCFLFLAFLFTQTLYGQDCSDNTLYVTPEGRGLGSKSSPADLLTALAMCKSDTSRHLIKLSTGTHTISQTLEIPSYVTIDGNFDATNGMWKKSETLNCIVSVSPPGDEIKTVTSDDKEVIVGHYIGIRLDTVKNITLRDFTLEVHKKNNFYSDMTYDGDGKSVYGIYGTKNEKIYLINLHIITEDGGEGLYGYQGYDGASAYYNRPGVTVFDPAEHSYYRPKPSEELLASYEFRAGGEGGAGGRIQDYYRCLDCFSTAISATTFCAAESPLPKGGRGGKNGGVGGESGENCEMDCYYEYYKSKTSIANELLKLLDLPASSPKDPVPHPGEDGEDGTGIYNGPDYTDQTIYGYDDINYYYIPGNGEKGGDGSGGSGGGGGGAGGIRTLGLVPKIPGIPGDYNLPGKMLGVFNKGITLIGGDDVCHAEIVNGSTEGGAGGAGGEGGEGGGGGHGGGASIGVFLLYSTNVVDNNCVYTIGEGGEGGFGGYGGDGGDGGLGLAGRPVNDGGWSYQGAKGGKGGAGGKGSRGQHGSNGRSIAKVGVSNRPAPFMMSDIVTGCTNSVFSIYASSGGSLFNTITGSSNDVPLVKNTPAGSTYTAFMNYVQVATPDLGTLAISYMHPDLYPWQRSTVKITTQRALPSLNVPAVLCLGDTLDLSSDVDNPSYSWRIYNSNNEIIYSSDKKSITFFPKSTGTYTVGFQAYDICCGLSTPQYKTFRVSDVKKPSIVKLNNDLPYCFGSDSSRFEITSAVQLTDQLKWSDGRTSKTNYVKHAGWYAVTLTTEDGCVAKSDSIENFVLTLPEGKPAINDLSNICNLQEITLMPDYEVGIVYNFYVQSTTKTSGVLPGGAKKHSLTTSAFFQNQDSRSFFIRKVNTHLLRYNYEVNCISDEVKEVKIYKDKYPPVIVSDNVMRDIGTESTRCGTKYTYAYPKALDNCNPNITINVRQMPANHYYPLGRTMDTLRYTDISGNTLDYPIEITVHDGEAPKIKTKPASDYIEIANEPGTCGAYYPFTMATAMDNCTAMPSLTGVIPEIITTSGMGYVSSYLISGSQADSIFNVGKNTIRQTWADATGNELVYEQTINVKDTEVPVLQCSDKTYYVEKGKTSVFTAYNAPLVTDNCSVYLTSTFVSGFGQMGEHPIGTTVERWKATDASGNIGVCVFNLTVLDTISPSIDCSVKPSALTIAGADSAQVTFATPPAFDNSGITTVTTTGKGSGAYYKTGEHELVYTATDPSGNTASCKIAVVVSDSEAPAITCPANIQVSNDPGLCGATVNFTIADAPDNDGSHYAPWKVTGLASGSVFPMGTTTEFFRVADAYGNTASCSFDVTVTDTEAPVFTACPGNIIENITPAVCGKMISLSIPAATDNSCTSPITGFVSGSAGGFFPVGVTHQVYRTRDAYGNSATCEFDVTVIDNTTLSITCPGDVEMNTVPGLCGAVPSIQFPTANIQYGCLKWELLSVKGIGDLFIPGEHTVTYKATAVGQSATCSFKVKINDRESPKISQPENIVTYLDPGNCGKVITFADPVVTDNCSNGHTFRTKGLASGSVFPIGTTVQQYLTTDILNAVSVSFTISVLDTIAPSFTDLPAIVESTPDICGKVIHFSAPVATDNSTCFTVTQLSGLKSGDLFPIGITPQAYLVKDAAGNADTTRFNVEIISTPGAGFNNCPADVVVVSDNGMTKVVWYDIPGRNACAGVTSLLLSGKGSGATFPAGTTRETYLITDASGKTDTCSFRVIVTEMNPPYIICSEPYQFQLVDSICGAKVKIPVPEVDDFGGSGLLTIFNDLGPNDSAVFIPVGYSQIIWTAVDNSGNRGYCYNQIMVGKEESPENPFSSHVQVCEGSTVEIDPKMSGEGPYVYEWSYYDPAIFTSVVVSTDSIFRIPSVAESDERQYMYRVSSPCRYTIYQREFMLRVNPAPVVTLTGLDAGYCEYDLSGESISYSPAGGVLVGDGLAAEKFYPSKAGIGTHTIAYVYYDSALGCPSTARLTVNVYETPQVSAFIDSAYCVNNQTLQLDAVNSTYAGPGISGSTFRATLAQAGTHTITRTVTVNGCVNSLAQNVRIQGNVPDASILTTGPLCSNQSRVKLEAVTAGGTWTGPTVYTDSSNVAWFNVNIATLGEHKVIHKVVDDVCTAIDSVMIDVKDSEYGLPYALDAYCYDQGLVALDVSDNKNYFGYGIDNNKFNPMAYDTTTIALYGISTLNSNGCVDTVWRAMAVLKPEIIDPFKLICQAGDPAELSVNADLAAVKWFDNTTGYTKTVSDVGSYTVEMLNTTGCIKIDTFFVQSKQAVLPALINHTRAVYKCAEASIGLNVEADYNSYAWSTGAQGASITADSPGEYTVYVTDDEDCELHDSILVSDYLSVENNQIVNHGTYLEAIASTSYAWYINGVLIEGESGGTLTVEEPGDYYVSLLDSNGCVSASDVIPVTVTSIQGENRNTGCLIYPNPGKGTYIFQFAAEPEADLEIVFTDVLGKQVKQLRIDHRSDQLTYSVSLEDQPSGVFWAHIKQRDRTTIVKLVKVD